MNGIAAICQRIRAHCKGINSVNEGTPRSRISANRKVINIVVGQILYCSGAQIVISIQRGTKRTTMKWEGIVVYSIPVETNNRGAGTGTIYGAALVEYLIIGNNVCIDIEVSG